MKRKVLKIIGIVFLVFIVLLVAAPFVLKGKIADVIKNKVNNNINANFDFAEADLSLFGNFPNAEVSLEDIVLINQAPFEGDTLFAAKHLRLKMSVKELFKSTEDPIRITHIKLDDALIRVKVDAAENANYDIGKETGESGAKEDSSESFTLALASYEITNTEITYDDYSAGMHLELLEMNHSGTGDLSLETSELDTHTNAKVTFELDSTRYLNNYKVALDALIGIDLKESKYTFLKNEAKINNLPLVFDGFVQVNENNQEVDVNFKTPSTDFKNFLEVIPEAYAQNIADVKTTGNFEVSGVFKGVVDEAHIPTFNVNINSDNASFKYPDLPKTVGQVNIDTQIANTTGITEDTYVNVNKLSFKIDEDTFNMTAKATELLGNPKVKAHVDAKMNLANIAQAYPVPEDMDVKGLLDADITTAFDMASVEQEKYENTQTSGNLALRNFKYASEEIPNPVLIDASSLTFNPKTVTLNELSGTTGKTDFKAVGTINNFLGFVFNDENVEGNFSLNADTFALDDFMVEETTTEVEKEGEESQTTAPTGEETIKIPSFLDCTIKANAKTVLYDNLTLKNVSGILKIKDEEAVLTNMKSSLFNGNLSLNGKVSTKNEAPSFAMKLGMDDFKIGETFKALELFKVLAPVANALQGKLDSDIEISGNLNEDFTPNMASISGKVLAEVLATNINPNSEKLLTSLTNKLNFLKVDKLNLKGLKTALAFEDGQVKVKPFTIAYEDININVTGSHTFDQKLSYTATLDVPAKYLGNEVNTLIAKIDDSALEDLTIPVTANIGGGYTSPEVKTDLSSGVKALTAKLVEVQKQKLINQGKGKAEELLGDILNKNTENDSTASTNGVKEVIGGILGGNKQAADTTGTTSDSTAVVKDPIKEKATDIIGSLFKKKKKKDSTTTEKDSVN